MKKVCIITLMAINTLIRAQEYNITCSQNTFIGELISQHPDPVGTGNTFICSVVMGDPNDDVEIRIGNKWVKYAPVERKKGQSTNDDECTQTRMSAEENDDEDPALNASIGYKWKGSDLYVLIGNKRVKYVWARDPAEANESCFVGYCMKDGQHPTWGLHSGYKWDVDVNGVACLYVRVGYKWVKYKPADPTYAIENLNDSFIRSQEEIPK